VLARVTGLARRPTLEATMLNGHVVEGRKGAGGGQTAGQVLGYRYRHCCGHDGKNIMLRGVKSASNFVCLFGALPVVLDGGPYKLEPRREERR
jgi:hypothetical protein